MKVYHKTRHLTGTLLSIKKYSEEGVLWYVDTNFNSSFFRPSWYEHLMVPLGVTNEDSIILLKDNLKKEEY